jgi:TldD protein
MSNLLTSDKIFFGANTGWDLDQVSRQLQTGLVGCDDGELFLEYCLSESLAWDDGKLKASSYDIHQGYGLRAVAGEAVGYAHATDMSLASLARSAEAVAVVRKNYHGHLAAAPVGTNRHLYADINPLAGIGFAEKIKVLEQIDHFTRQLDPRVKQVMTSLYAEWQVVQIIRPDGQRTADIRPLVRLGITVMVEQNGRMESGSYGAGGREAYDTYLYPKYWQDAARDALRQGILKLDARPAPAGEMTVVLGPGWPGVLLHEAIGHGFEGDFNRKGTSVFAGMMGQTIAHPDVTVVDDGTLPNRRGSITVDDEGTPSQRNVIVEGGKLVNFLQDRQNARLMGVKPTGNGRRQSYAHLPMPRMTNTYMLNGKMAPGEIIASVKNGVYASNFGGGQVDITSGQFVFSASEAYLIEDGKITAPIKGATLIGKGADALQKIKMVGNDMALDQGVGTCGKDGQSVPVGVGQPTLRLDNLTVGGTQA